MSSLGKQTKHVVSWKEHPETKGEKITTIGSKRGTTRKGRDCWPSTVSDWPLTESSWAFSPEFQSYLLIHDGDHSRKGRSPAIFLWRRRVLWGLLCVLHLPASDKCCSKSSSIMSNHVTIRSSSTVGMICTAASTNTLTHIPPLTNESHSFKLLPSTANNNIITLRTFRPRVRLMRTSVMYSLL